MAKIVSKVYAAASFELALEKQSVTALYEEAEALRKIFRDNGELMQLLTHPKISKEEKEAAVKAIFDGRVSDDMAGFLVLVVDKGRADELDAVLGYFLSVVKEYKKIGVVDVASAVELTDAQKEKLCEKLLATTDYATLEVNYRVDAALIGGLVVRIGDRVVDSSIRTKLSQMEKQLQRIQLS